MSVVVFFFVPHLLTKADIPSKADIDPLPSIPVAPLPGSCPNNPTDNSGEDWRGPFFVSPFSEITSSWLSVISFCRFFSLLGQKGTPSLCVCQHFYPSQLLLSLFLFVTTAITTPPFPLLLSSSGAIYRSESSCHLHLSVTLTLLSCLSLFANASSRSPSLQASGTSRH